VLQGGLKRWERGCGPTHGQIREWMGHPNIWHTLQNFAESTANDYGFVQMALE